MLLIMKKLRNGLKKMYQQLNKTDKLSNYDDKYILFNFRFTLIETKLDTSDYKNIFNKIITHYSKITVW